MGGRFISYMYLKEMYLSSLEEVFEIDGVGVKGTDGNDTDVDGMGSFVISLSSQSSSLSSTH